MPMNPPRSSTRTRCALQTMAGGCRCPGWPAGGLSLRTRRAARRAAGSAVAARARPDAERDRDAAAVTYFTPAADFAPRRYRLMFEVQVEAPFHLAQLVIPQLREKGRGWILNISSGAARHPRIPPNGRLAGGTVYGMCKAALERFSTGLAAELYDDNIAVNALSPSKVVPTPGTLFHHLTTQDDADAEPPQVMAEAAVLLCSAEPKTLTGRIAYSQALLAELNGQSRA